ncbi:MAG: hydrogenase nickel incorporation protein HypB [Synergistaceae bacterium]|nr:hydrogenase nickel incorporation protein HypB [Synergistaceae bacterium]
MMAVITLRQSVMAEDEKYAARIRQAMSERGTLLINVIGSPGCGKTTLLEETRERNKGAFSFGVVEGDLETSRDAERLAQRGIPAVQINTKGACHLEAHVVEKALASLPDRLDVIFIENVGNLVCPAEFDLGEDFKVAVSSVPEGEDKPIKYPSLFAQAEAVLLTKTDLLPYTRFDVDAFTRDVRTLNPSAPLIALDLLGAGAHMDDWVEFVARRLREKRDGQALLGVG